MIKENIQLVKENIVRAASKKGRNPDDITLIAVSKTMPVEDLMEAYNAGTRVFGENKVQELCEKYEVMPKDIRWHMIGHLQTNKVKYIVDKVELIHSVDSMKLAEQIEKEAEKKNVDVDILVEVNVAEEDTKFGTTTDAAMKLVEEISALKRVHIKGLMTIAPYTENPEENRKYFAKLKQLSVDIMKKNTDNISMSVLSMGMTGDYTVAVEEGATLVRVGTGIFGVRNYNI